MCMKKNKKTKAKPLSEKEHKELKHKEAINMMNDVIKIRIAPSEVHGVGVFAMRDIKKGEKLYATAIPSYQDLPYKKFKELRPEIAEMILERFPQVALDNSHFMSPDTLMQMYMNHGLGKDANYNAHTDKALRDIKKGEEILEDYTKIPNYDKVFKWIKKKK